MASDVVAPAAESAAANGHGEAHSTARFTALLIGSIGVVYGDIGTRGQRFCGRCHAASRSGRALIDRVGADHRGDA